MNAIAPKPVITCDPPTMISFTGLLREPGEVFEIRALNYTDDPEGRYATTLSGFFDDPELAAAEVAKWAARGTAEAWYVTLNPLNPDLLALANNRLKPRAKVTAADTDVLRRTRLLVDVDPVRKSGISSTDAELALANATADAIVEFLAQHGFPQPIRTMSGNGAGLIYAVDLPTDDGGLLSRFLKALAARFDTDKAKVDVSVHNAARITKLAGTTAAKGENMPDRPHRMSRFVSAPEMLVVVSEDLLRDIAGDADAAGEPTNETPKLRADGARRFAQFPATPAGVAGYLRDYGADVKNVIGNKITLGKCPVRAGCDSTNGTDIAVLVEPGGKISYKNLHSRGEGLTWADVREALEPGYKLWVERSRNGQASPATPHPSATAAPERSEPPTILVPGAHLTNTGEYFEIGNNDFAAAGLAAFPADSIYRRGVPGIIVGDPGARTFNPMQVDDMRMLADAHMRLTRWVTKTAKGEEPKQVCVYLPCNRDNGGLLLAAAGSSSRIPEVKTLTSYPVFVTGFELARPGYHDGTYYDEPPELRGFVPELDPKVIRRTLADLIVDFPLKDEASRQNVYGLLLTPLTRPAYDGNAPLHLIMSPLERTGKTKLAEQVLGGVIMGQRVAPMQMAASEEEMDKRITGTLLAGHSILHLDNIREHVDSASLASLLTSRVYCGRQLGSLRMLGVPNNTTIVGTGNNIKATGEIAKRTVPIWLQPASDAPEERRDFVHPDLWGYVLKSRKRVLECLAGMVINWKRAGSPQGTVAMGGFDEWAAIVGGILNHAGFNEWMGNTKGWRSEADTRREDLRAFVRAWALEHRSAPTTAGELLMIAKRLDLFEDVLNPDKNDRANQTALGMRILSRIVGTPIENFIIHRNPETRPVTYELKRLDGAEVPQ